MINGPGLALQVGARLEELDAQKKRAEDAKFLIQCWQDVSERGDLSHLEDMRRLGGSDGKVKCAHIARQLLEISNRTASGPHNWTNGATSWLVKKMKACNAYSPRISSSESLSQCQWTLVLCSGRYPQ